MLVSHRIAPLYLGAAQSQHFRAAREALSKAEEDDR